MVTILGLVVRVLEWAFRNHTYTMRAGLAKGLKRRFGFGSKPKFSLTVEEKFLMNLDWRGKMVFDIGAYVGIYALFFARAVGDSGQVISFEPNPTSYTELVYNVKLNGFSNVTAIQMGLGMKQEQKNLVIDPVYPARASIEKSIQPLQQIKRDRRHVAVDLDSLDNQIEKRNLPKPDFVKIDAEGLESDVLQGMEDTINKFKPTLFIEIHGKLQKTMIEGLVAKGYSIYHIESDSRIPARGYPPIQGGHLFCKQ